MSNSKTTNKILVFNYGKASYILFSIYLIVAFIGLIILSPEAKIYSFLNGAIISLLGFIIGLIGLAVDFIQKRRLTKSIIGILINILPAVLFIYFTFFN